MAGLHHDPKFYQVEAKRNLAQVNLILDTDYSQLKIEKHHSLPNSPSSPSRLSRTSFRMPNWYRNSLRKTFSRRGSSSSAPMISTRTEDEVIELSEVKEVRVTLFDSKLVSANALKKLKSSHAHLKQCQSYKFKQVMIFFGKEFNLKTRLFLVVEPPVEEEGGLLEWIEQIRGLVRKAQSLAYFDKLAMWYMKEFKQTVLKSRDNHRLKYWKQFLTKCHHRTSTESLSFLYDDLESRLRQVSSDWCRGYLDKQEFDVTVRCFLHSPQAIASVFDWLSTYRLNEHGDGILTILDRFQGNELESEIREHPSVKFVLDVVRDYFLHLKKRGDGGRMLLPEVNLAIVDDASSFTKDLLRKLAEQFHTQMRFSLQENQLSSQVLLDYLFCDENTIWEPRYDRVYQDMTRPLSHYWIASSHNTYLTGDQYSSQSSVEAYTRVLRQGCRCIEIDVWNGPWNKPIVKHGMTLTTSVSLKEVLIAIKENAFITTSYPLIISVENHCGLKQQKVMAKLFRKTFGRMLLTSPLPSSSSSSFIQLPSPEQLRDKIIVKGRKLPWKLEEEEEPERVDELAMLGVEGIPLNDNNSSNNEPNPCDCLMSGELLKKNDKGEWIPCIFVLTNKKLFYIERRDEEDDGIGKGKLPNYLMLQQRAFFRRSGTSLESSSDLHVDQPWFHGKIPGGRATATALLEECGVTGTFLVRKSDSTQGSFVLSFCGNWKTYDCLIHSKMTNENEPMFHLKSDPKDEIFSSLYELIDFYRTHPFSTPDCQENYLIQPVPPSRSHEDEEWFYKDMDRVSAEKVLEKLPINGAFLGRYRSENRSEIVISFRFENVIKHCHIKAAGRYLTVSNLKFPKLERVVEHYERNPFYKDIKLSHPVGPELLKKSQQSDWVARVYADPEYLNSTVKTVRGRVRAIQSYTSKEPDLLSFRKGDIIINVVKDADGWWWGTREDACGVDAIPKQFCSSFVEEFEELECPFGDILCKGELKLGLGAKVKFCKNKNGIENGIKFYIQFKDHDGTKRKVGAACSKRKANEWVEMINHVVDRDKQGKLTLAKFNAFLKHNIATEFSDLIIYCCAMEQLDPDEISLDKEKICPTSVKSFDEVTGDRQFRARPPYFVWYHQYAMTRIYPKGFRLDSSNLNPARFWNFGSQMVALNYQTPDKPMQLNRGKFRQNGNCGFVLKPDFMISETQDKAKFQFDPNQLNEKDDSLLHQHLHLNIEVIAARHLQKEGSSAAIRPLVEVEVVGADVDCTKTRTNPADTGLCPCWSHTIDLNILCPDLALIQFSVCDVDTFSG